MWSPTRYLSCYQHLTKRLLNQRWVVYWSIHLPSTLLSNLSKSKDVAPRTLIVRQGDCPYLVAAEIPADAHLQCGDIGDIG